MWCHSTGHCALGAREALHHLCHGVLGRYVSFGVETKLAPSLSACCVPKHGVPTRLLLMCTVPRRASSRNPVEYEGPYDGKRGDCHRASELCASVRFFHRLLFPPACASVATICIRHDRHLCWGVSLRVLRAESTTSAQTKEDEIRENGTESKDSRVVYCRAACRVRAR